MASENVRDLLTSACVVLWDFDGPICRLFAGHRANRAAAELMEWLKGQGLHGLLGEAERDTEDPHAVLRAVGRRYPDSDLVAELEERLTKEELRAVPTAMPTAFADPLIRTWTATGARLAIATNNSPQVVREYLVGRGLLDCFLPHIYGRTQDLQHLKPSPHYLNRALSAMGAAPSSALFIGDAPTDCQAARRAGVPFLGYARNNDKEKLLQDAGATDIVGSLDPLLHTLRGCAMTGHRAAGHAEAGRPRGDQESPGGRGPCDVGPVHRHTPRATPTIRARGNACMPYEITDAE